MIRIMLTAAVAASALTAGTAYADCATRMGNVEKEYGKTLSMQGQTDRTHRTVIQNLRNAAVSLKMQGDEEGCEAVMSALEDVAEGFRANSEETQPAASETPAEGRRAEIEARVVAVKDGNMTIDTSNLIGINVYNYKDEFLGEIDGLLVKAGNAPTHMIVGHGGFWNIGDEEAAVPVDKFSWDPEWEVFYVDISEDQLDNAPDYDLEDGKWTPDQNDGYYSNLNN